MRLTLMLLVVLAAPAHAKTGRELAHDMIAASIIEGGFDAEIASVVADCYSTRMTDAEVDALVTADGDVPAQQAVIANMAESQAALGCVAAVLE